jgi:hypothetical protein
MSKLQSVLQIFRDNLKTLPREKIAQLEKTLKSLEISEYVGYMNWQAEMHASGMISLEDAQFIYNTIKDWDSADLASKLVVTQIMAEYGKKKISDRSVGSKNNPFKRRKVATRKRDESQRNDYKIIAETPWLGFSDDRYRFVTVEWYTTSGEVKEYSSHMQDRKNMALYYGLYTKNKQSALTSMRARWNKDYDLFRPAIVDSENTIFRKTITKNKPKRKITKRNTK